MEKAEKPPKPDVPVTWKAELPRTSGVVPRVKADPEHVLGMGYDGKVAAVITHEVIAVIADGRHGSGLDPSVWASSSGA